MTSIRTIRKRSKPVAKRVQAQISSAIRDLRRRLKRQDCRKNRYASPGECVIVRVVDKFPVSGKQQK